WHPLLTAWRFLEPLLLGQVRTDKRVIAAHYDRDAEFFLQFLDPKQPMYTQGIYEHDDEPLEAATLRKFDYCYEQCRLKPGDRIFLDGVAFTKKYALASYIAKHIYPGNHSYLVLHDFLEKVARTPLQVREIFDDRYSYFLTFQQWARNFDRNRETVVRQFGELDFRRFRLYLWGSAYQFFSRGLGCFRMIIEYPVPEPGR